MEGSRTVATLRAAKPNIEKTRFISEQNHPGIQSGMAPTIPGAIIWDGVSNWEVDSIPNPAMTFQSGANVLTFLPSNALDFDEIIVDGVIWDYETAGDFVRGPATQVPELSSFAMACVGLTSVCFARRR